MNKYDELFDKQESLIGEIEFFWESYENGSTVNEVRTNKESVETFVEGESLISIDDVWVDDSIRAVRQHYSNGKTITSYFNEEGKLINTLLKYDPEKSRNSSKLKYIIELLSELEKLECEIESKENQGDE